MEAILISVAAVTAGLSFVLGRISKSRTEKLIKEAEELLGDPIVVQATVAPEPIITPAPKPEPDPEPATETESPEEAEAKRVLYGFLYIQTALKPMRSTQNQASFVLVVRQLTGNNEWTVAKFGREHGKITAEHIENVARWFFGAKLFETPEECVRQAALRVLIK